MNKKAENAPISSAKAKLNLSVVKTDVRTTGLVAQGLFFQNV